MTLIEKAVVFYTGYLSANENGKYIPNVVTSTLKSIIDESDTRMSRRMVFKLGFNTGEIWRTMLRTQTANLSESFKISMQNLRWYVVSAERKCPQNLYGSHAAEDSTGVE